MSDSATALGVAGPTGRPSTTAAGLRATWHARTVPRPCAFPKKGEHGGCLGTHIAKSVALAWRIGCAARRIGLPDVWGHREGAREGRPRRRAATHCRGALRAARAGLEAPARTPAIRGRPAAFRPPPPQPAGVRRRSGPYLCRAFWRRAGRHSPWEGAAARRPRRALLRAVRQRRAGGRGAVPALSRPPRASGGRQDPRSRQ